MGILRLGLNGLRHHWRMHLAVALGVAAGTAVLTGALLVGDSVRGSLRDLTLERLGQVDVVLIAPRFFRPKLADEIAARPDFGESFASARPAIFMRASVEHEVQRTNAQDDTRGNRPIRRFSGQVALYGIDDDFWQLGDMRPAGLAAKDGLEAVILNQALADELEAKIGDVIVLKLPEQSLVPADSVLGRKQDTVGTGRFHVADVVPTRGLGRFSLHPNQQLPLNAFVARSAAAELLDQQGKVNAVLLTGRQPANEAPPDIAVERLRETLRPELEDYGIRVEQIEFGGAAYFNVTTDRMLFDTAATEAIEAVAARHGGQSVLTYLANLISAGPPVDDPHTDKPVPRSIPYSTVTALDLEAAARLGDWQFTLGEVTGPLAADEIVLNDWAYNSLKLDLEKDGRELNLGDEIRITYFLPEHVEGAGEERTEAFRLKAVVRLKREAAEGAEQTPLAPADRHFTPVVKGLTDKRSLRNWDAPFEYHEQRVRIGRDFPGQDDDAYFQEFNLAPKAFVSLERGQDLWGTERFGRVSSFRVPASGGLSAATLEQELLQAIEPQAIGFAFQPVKAEGLKAAAGTTPFSVLFLAFSFFIIAAAVMLVALLFRLGVENRAEEVGVLLAGGFSRKQVRLVLGIEGLIVAALGSVAGAAAGTLYAWIMLYGLRTWWVAAVSTPFLTFHSSWLSYAIGYASGVAIAWLAVWWTLFRMRKLPVRRLLAGRASDESLAAARKPRLLLIGGGLLVAAAVGLAVAAFVLGGEAQAGAFFGSGACMLIAGLLLMFARFRGGAGGSLTKRPATIRLAMRNGARNPGRSTLTIGLVAAAAFLIAALSAFQMDPSQQGPSKNSGNGGFAYLAESATPISFELFDAADRRANLSLNKADQGTLDDVRIYALRELPGEDASCNNLYQTARPRLLGLPPAFIERGGFAWGSTAAETDAELENPWRLLETAPVDETENGEPIIPVVIDQNTAMYSLKLYQVGQALKFEDDWGRSTHFKLVGMLKNSVFQGAVLMSEKNLLQRFPEVSGFRFFLIEARESAGKQRGADFQLAEEISAAQADRMPAPLLESALSDYGFDVQETGQVLADFLAVQNTYISTFQSLGALGLLLGTFGLATVQLRNVLERRGELALLRATGFRKRKLAALVLAENAFLLLAGLLIGLFAAAVAVLPHLLSGGANVPVAYLSAVFAIILLVGLAAGLFAVRATLKAPLIQALRGS